MMYLPRLCEHCLNPACVAACPSGADLQARGGRHRPDRPGQVPRLAHVRIRLPVQEDLLQLVVGQIGKMHLLLSAHRGRPANGVLGNLRRTHPLSRRRALRRRPHPGSRVGPDEGDLYEAQLKVFLDPFDPAVQAQARRDGISRGLAGGCPTSPIWKMAMDWKIAFPLHPEYRTLPMVWYVPPLSPIQLAAAEGDLGSSAACPT